MEKLTKQINHKKVCVREQVEGVQRYLTVTVSSLYSSSSESKESSFSASCLFPALTESTEGKSFPPLRSPQKTLEYLKLNRLITFFQFHQ